jgi:hypothetical protein
VKRRERGRERKREEKRGAEKKMSRSSGKRVYSTWQGAVALLKAAALHIHETS